MKTIRIASGQGFWGDWLEAPINQIDGGPIDYLMLDYLAEVTMSIMQKQRLRNPSLGYARDFVTLIKSVLPRLLERNIRVVSNAGGVNPSACAEAICLIANQLRETSSIPKFRIGIVAGDDIMEKLDFLLEQGYPLKNMDTGESLSKVRNQVLSANVYFGAQPIVEALKQNAQIIVTGRCTDTGLTLGPLCHEFNWAENDWNKLASGTIAGHTIECGAQASGGNCLVNWESIPNLENVGFPIVEAYEDGTFVITKHPNTGGLITPAVIKEQLVYEMGNPREYITPDCIADFTTIHLEDNGKDRVRFHGIEGYCFTDFYKVSISFSAGYKAVGSLVYAWPDAYKKAQAADRILRTRLDHLNLKFDEILTEYVGVNSCHGLLAGDPSPDIPEVMLRVGVRSSDKDSVERFTKEIAPLILTGPPSVTGFAGGRPKVEEIVAYWPALLPKNSVTPEVKIIEI